MKPSDDETAIQRLAVFSDVVFAVAIVVLIFQIRVPDPAVPPDEIHDALGDAVEAIAGFVLSALLLGGFWIAHHQAFDRVRAWTPGLLWINLAFLLCIAFFPFPSAVLGNHFDSSVAVIFYAGCTAGTALVWCALCWRLMVDPELLLPGQRTAVREMLIWGVAMTLIFVLSLPGSAVIFEISSSGVSLATIFWLVTLPIAAGRLSALATAPESWL
jgi:uncharacterized membrane protein